MQEVQDSTRTPRREGSMRTRAGAQAPPEASNPVVRVTADVSGSEVLCFPVSLAPPCLWLHIGPMSRQVVDIVIQSFIHAQIRAPMHAHLLKCVYIFEKILL